MAIDNSPSEREARQTRIFDLRRRWRVAGRIDDDEFKEMQRLETEAECDKREDEWKRSQATAKPAPAGVTRKIFAKALAYLVESGNKRFGELQKDIDELNERVAALEATGIKFCGTWARGNEYGRGSVVVYDGASWTAIRHINPNEKPGDGDGWHLLAAKGRDAKDRR